MVIVKADKNSEAGVMPDEQLLTDMGKFNEELVKAGVMLAGEGLHPTSKAARVKFSGGRQTVSRGPFNLTEDLIAGFPLQRIECRARQFREPPTDAARARQALKAADTQNQWVAFEMKKMPQTLAARVGILRRG